MKKIIFFLIVTGIMLFGIIQVSAAEVPSIFINSPVEGFPYTFKGVINMSLDINAFDVSGISSMWYSQNNGANNYTFNNKTVVILSQPEDSTSSYTIFVWVMNNNGNVSSKSVTFQVTKLFNNVGGGGTYNSTNTENVSALISNTKKPTECNINGAEGIRDCIIVFINASYQNWVVFILIVCAILIVTEYFDVGLTRLISGKRQKEEVPRTKYFPRGE